MSQLENQEIQSLLFSGQSEHARLFNIYNKDNYIVVSRKGSDGYYFNDTTKLWTELSNAQLLNDVTNFLHMMVDKQIEIIKKKLLSDVGGGVGDRNRVVIVRDEDEIKNFNIKISKLTKLRLSNAKSSHGKAIIEFILIFFFREDFMNKIDSSDHILPINNGRVIDLKTKIIRERTRADLFTYELNVSITEQTPHATKFFSELMTNDKIKLNVFQRMLGYSISGNCDSKCFFSLIGAGDNGKSALMRIIQTIFKPLFCAIQKAILFTENRSKSDMMPYLACLAGKRFGVYNEPSDKLEINESMIKGITGGDEILAKKLYCNPFSFTPIVKIWILSNKIIHFDTCSEPMVKRAKIIHMDAEFTDNPTKPNQYKKDPEFVRQLENIYIDEVFSFIVQGAFEYYKYKSFGDEECVSMQSYKNEYMGKIDISQSFLNERCEIGPKFKIKPSDVFEDYVEYCKEHDIQMVKRNKFYESLTNKKIFTKRIRGLDYYSIQLKNNLVEDNNNDDIDELEGGIDKTIKEVIYSFDAINILIKQLQEKEKTDDALFEQEDNEIKKIIKEHDANLELSKDNSLPEKRDVVISSSDANLKRIIDWDLDSNSSNSDSDSDSDSDCDINEIGIEDYSFLINF